METKEEKIFNYLVNELLGEESEGLENSTELITGGLLDSISTLQLVDFLEKEFSIEFQANEVDQEHLNSIDIIVKTINEKSNGQ